MPMVYTLSGRKVSRLKTGHWNSIMKTEERHQHRQPLQRTTLKWLQLNYAFAGAATRHSPSGNCIQICSSMMPESLEPGEKTAGQRAVRAHLRRCHGSSCCACQGGTSVNMSPQSGITVATHSRGGEPVISDTGQRCQPNSRCWMPGMQKVQ